MKHSAELDKLAVALSKTQSQMKAAVKDTENPFFKKNYADLSSVWEAVREALTTNGLSVSQGTSAEGADGILWTMLLHTSGQYIIGECPLILGKRDPQGVGSAMTYYRRYGLAAILGVVQEDDDANSAQPSKPREIPKPQAPAPKDESALQDWAAKLDEAASLQELAATWAKVPAQHQSALTKMKDNLKRKLEGK